MQKVFYLHDGAIAPILLPWATSNYVLNEHLEISPLSHLTADDVNAELDSDRVTPRKKQNIV